MNNQLFYIKCLRKDLVTKLNIIDQNSILEIKYIHLFHNTDWTSSVNNPQLAEAGLLFESLSGKRSLLTYRKRSSEGNRVIEHAGSFRSTLRRKNIYSFFHLLGIFTRWYWPTLITLPVLATWVNFSKNNCIFELPDINFLFHIPEPLASTSLTIGVQIGWTNNNFNHFVVLWSGFGLKPVLKFKGRYNHR